MAKNSGITVEDILGKTDNHIRKTKIVCTIGPSSCEVMTLVKMLNLGMNVARLNFSHVDHAYHAGMVTNI
jgi:pyruvate kinase